jgi:hypothetical protein
MLMAFKPPRKPLTFGIQLVLGMLLAVWDFSKEQLLCFFNLISNIQRTYEINQGNSEHYRNTYRG